MFEHPGAELQRVHGYPFVDAVEQTCEIKVVRQPQPAPGDYSDTITVTMSYGGQTATTSFHSRDREAPSCAMSATNLSFKSYAQAQLDGQSAISVTCSNATPWTVGLNGGTSFGATVNRRRMTGPGLASLQYDLYKDAARTQIWGDRGTDTLSGTGTGNPQTLNVYGRIPATQRAPSGGYNDTITATSGNEGENAGE